MALEIDLQIAISDAAEAELPKTVDLENWIAAVLEREVDPRSELTIRFVEYDESQQLNRDYRGKDNPTNVLSFPFEPPPNFEPSLLGDLVICHEIVVSEAQEQGKSTHDHYAHLVIHGCLHLLGYDHTGDEEAKRMEALERTLLARFGIANPYCDIDSIPHAQISTHNPDTQCHADTGKIFLPSLGTIKRDLYPNGRTAR